MADRARHHATQYGIIQKHFRDNAAAETLPQLRSWHKDYQEVADDKLTFDLEVIKDVQPDTLDSATVDKCITELADEIHVTQRFCADCQHLFDNWPDLSDLEAIDPMTEQNWPGSGADWKHAVTRSLHTMILEAAAQKGCMFCAFLVQMLRDGDALETFRKLELRLVALGVESMASLSVQNWGINSSQLLWINLPGKVCDHCNDAVAQVTGFESAALTSSADTYTEQSDVLDIAKDWLSNCAQNHEDCNGERRDQDKLPTRLISVDEDFPRLVLTAGWEKKEAPRYSTLSHCWGSEPFLRLTGQNIDALMERIPLSELPQTFNDAIQITRDLGLSYLWIDSLCIKQGDLADWVREAGSMSSVYGNSFINIAASSSSSVHGGCFVKPKSMVDGVRALVTISLSSHSLVREFRSQAVYDLNTTDSHLATRAWALQERILPPRTIHFGQRGAFWECKSTTANNFLPGGFQKQLGASIINERQRRGSFAHWWSKLVGLYSAANLTYPSDKLPALSGIARRTHDERGGAYVAGMWLDEDMLAQLCWRTGTPRARQVQRAPSWSWASVDGHVRYQVLQKGIKETKYARVLDAQMDLLGSDPFGQVRGGELRLACEGVLEATLFDATTLVMGDVRYPFSPDCNGKESGSGEEEEVYLLPLVAGHTGTAFYDAKEEEKLEKDTVTKPDSEEEDKWVSESSVVGLVLRKAMKGGKLHFERIGVFEFFKNPARNYNTIEEERYREERFESFITKFRRDTLQTVESLDLERFREENLFIITLV